MVISDATLEALRTNFNSIFQEAFVIPSDNAVQLATPVPSTSGSNTYGWMQKLPRMRQWLGERQYNNLKEHKYVLENLDWELSVSVDRNDIEDDNLGVYDPTIRMIGAQAALWGEDRIIELIEANGLCFDGQNFFDTDHPVTYADGSGSTTYANAFTSKALTAANFASVLASMKALKGADKKSFGSFRSASGIVLIVPPALETTAKAILMDERDASGATNTNRGAARLLVLNDLTSATTWYLADVSMPIKPFVLQTRKENEFVMMDTGSSEHVFKHKEYLFGVDNRGAAGYALPFLMAKATA